MRMLFVAEQKRWRAIQEKAASRFPSIREEEEEDIREGEREELPEELMDGIGMCPPRFLRLDCGTDQVSSWQTRRRRTG